MQIKKTLIILKLRMQANRYLDYQQPSMAGSLNKIKKLNKVIAYYSFYYNLNIPMCVSEATSLPM